MNKMFFNKLALIVIINVTYYYYLPPTLKIVIHQGGEVRRGLMCFSSVMVVRDVAGPLFVVPQ